MSMALDRFADDDMLRLQRLRRFEQLQQAMQVLDHDDQSKWLSDPVGWVNHRLGEHFWSKQVEIAESVRDNRRTAVQSCHGVGKSFCLSRLVCWWLDSHPIGEAFVVTTAPTFPQVRAILWREINRACKHGHLLRDQPPAETEWKIYGELVAFGRKPSDYEPTAFNGIHAKYVLVVIDEACGVPLNLWEAADTLLTGAGCRIVAIGNPDDPTSEFKKVCDPGSGWHNIHISYEVSPNFTGEEIPEYLRDLLVSPVWVEEKLKKWRPYDHPFWYSKLMGLFPEQAPDALVTSAMLRRAHDRHKEGQYDPTEPPNILAVDVARFGGDETVILHRTGNYSRIVETYGKVDTMTTTGHVIRAMKTYRAGTAFVDAIGVGGGVVDRLMELNVPITAMVASERARDPQAYANRRAEWYWTLRTEFEEDRAVIDPNDEELSTQLLGIKWKVDSRGRILIESKEDMKERGLDSPDRADALAMAYGGSVFDFDSMYDIHHCVNCDFGMILDARIGSRACPRCGRMNRYGERLMEDDEDASGVVEGIPGDADADGTTPLASGGSEDPDVGAESTGVVLHFFTSDTSQ